MPSQLADARIFPSRLKSTLYARVVWLACRTKVAANRFGTEGWGWAWQEQATISSGKTAANRKKTNPSFRTVESIAFQFLNGKGQTEELLTEASERPFSLFSLSPTALHKKSRLILAFLAFFAVNCFQSFYRKVRKESQTCAKKSQIRAIIYLTNQASSAEVKL